MEKQPTLENLTLHERTVVLSVLRAIRTVRFGTVALTIHDSQVVQIDKTERIRLKSSKDGSCS